MKKLLSYCKPYGWFLLLSLVVKVTGTLMDLVIPYLLGHILDNVVPHCTADNLSPIFLWGGGMILCAFVAVSSNIFANRRTAKFSKNVVHRIRGDLFEKILSLSAAQTDRFTIPSLVARMSSDSYQIHHMLNVLFRSGLRAPILLAGGLLVTISIEPVLSLSFIVSSPLLLFVVTWLSKRGIRLFKEKQEKVDAMVEKVRDTFTGIRVIKALSKVHYEKKSFERINKNLSYSEEKANVIMGASRPITNVFLNLGMTSVVAIGAFRVQSGATTPGQIISFLSYFTIILNATLALTRIFTSLSKGAASADRIEEVLMTKADLLPRSDLPTEEGAPYLEFRNVTFSYNNKKLPALENISFTLEQGETLGIIGGTGSGKTTLIRLLLRFYDPDEGQILLKGRDLRSYGKQELREHFGIVFQNDFLMADSLAENISFGREISPEAMEKATRCAQANTFIENLDAGLEHALTTGGQNLSGGQRQRVVLSRALAGNSPILILDDASSALDYKTDAALRTAIRKEFCGTTQIIVAQRISSIKHANLILVLEEGALIGKGDHETLSETCHVYNEIAVSQMGEVKK